ncbi:MAG: hypothetical protein K8S20_05260 [Chloroflexi bacterium]|nr:hypothetical protein [Chloroflexota bacterium]
MGHIPPPKHLPIAVDNGTLGLDAVVFASDEGLLRRKKILWKSEMVK